MSPPCTQSLEHSTSHNPRQHPKIAISIRKLTPNLLSTHQRLYRQKMMCYGVDGTGAVNVNYERNSFAIKSPHFDLFGKVANRAIRLVTQDQRSSPPRGPGKTPIKDCTGTTRETLGIPCIHEILLRQCRECPRYGSIPSTLVSHYT